MENSIYKHIKHINPYSDFIYLSVEDRLVQRLFSVGIKKNINKVFIKIVIISQ